MAKLLLRITLVMVLLLTGACGDDPSSPLDSAEPFAATTTGSYLPGEVLLQLRTEAGASRASATAADPENLLAGGKVIELIAIGGDRSTAAARAGVGSAPLPAVEIIRLLLPEGLTVESAVEQLSARSDILYAEPNYRVHRATVPNDLFFANEWGLKNSGQRLNGLTGTPGVDIGATAAWEFGTGNASVIVATIDTGIEYDHQDLAGNIWINPGETGLDSNNFEKQSNGIDDDDNGYIDDWRGWNYVATDPAAPKLANDPIDTDTVGNGDTRPLGHGSHVAGIIGALGNNGIGVSGINWQVRLMPLKFLDSIGNGSIADAVKAINYAVANGARVINASYEYSLTSGTATVSQTEMTAIAVAGSAGVLFVAAAGNNGAGAYGSDIDTGKKIYPAAHPLDNIIAVAAIDANGVKAGFSNYGGTSVDLCAPGVNIYSTVRSARTGLDHQAGYDYMNGTSMAAPMVSGAAALIWSRYPDLTVAELRRLLLYTVDTTPALNSVVASSGRLNLGRAMTVDLSLPAPAAPSDLTVEAQAVGARLLWGDESGSETAFIVERALSAQPFVMVARLDANTTTYTDSTYSDRETSRYRVRAIAGINPSAYSNIAEIVVTPPPADGSGSGSSKCFIATAAYGTPLAPQVAILRSFRDRVLLTNLPGRLFVALYYRTSPPLADFIAGHDSLRASVRTLLQPLIWLAALLTPESAAAMSPRPASPPAVVEEAGVVAGELLVCFDQELSDEGIAIILRSEQSERLEAISSPRGTLLRVKLPAGVPTALAQKNFSAYQGVVYAEPNQRVGIRRP